LSTSTPRAGPRRVVIIGGGFSGACAAVQLVRRSAAALAITLVDPAERPGRGLAYSAVDPDHRLNAPTYVHSLIPDDAWHFSRWCQDQGLLAADPEALRPDGSAYVRRADFGRYLEQTLQAHARWPATGSTIDHHRGTAVGLSAPGTPLAAHTAAGHALPADQVIIASGNPLPRLQPPFAPTLARHPAVIENPLDTPRLVTIPPGARVLLVGTGLTALDVLSTLVQRQHRGEMLAVSRRGQRPRPQGPLPAALAQAQRLSDLSRLPGSAVLDRLAGPAPDFLAPPAVPAELRAWLRALRTRIAQAEAVGDSWYIPFDALRDAVWQLWPTLPAAQQQRFLKKLRTWYDVHRFRSAPQNQDLVDRAQAAGRLRFQAARLHRVDAADDGPAIAVTMTPAGAAAAQREVFDVVINCTGLDVVAGLAANPLLSSLVASGRLRRDACGIGLAVDADCRALDAAGRPQPALRLVGPPTAGTFGDPLGAMFIGAQIHRMLPAALRDLGVVDAGPAGPWIRPPSDR